MISIDFSSSSQKKKSGGSRIPKSISCYICGRQYMIHSFQIHEVQCRQLYIDRENLKPLKERRRLPDNPFNSLGKNKTIEELNDVAYQSYTSNLSSCKNCNRKFTEEKLLIHNRSCTSSNPARRIDESVNRRTSLSDLNQMGYSLDRIDKENRMTTSIIPAELQQCPTCFRSFNERAFNKHTRICKNVFVDKRKTFDSRKKRIEGTELAGYYNNKQNKRNTINTTIKTQRITSSSTITTASTFDNKTKQAISSSSSSSSSSSWRQQSQQFRQAMKAARLIKYAQNKSNITGIPLSYLLPPSLPPNENDYKDYIQCDTCGRKFSQMAGERHIPQCRNIRNKPSVLMAGSGHVATTFRTDSLKRNSRRNSFDIDMKQREQHKPDSPSKSSRKAIDTSKSLKSPRTNPINEQILNNKSRTLNDISISMPKVPTRLRR